MIFKEGKMRMNKWKTSVEAMLSHMHVEQHFTLSDVYDKLLTLSDRNDKYAKGYIRYYLQRSRDAGYIEFISRGDYKKLK